MEKLEEAWNGALQGFQLWIVQRQSKWIFGSCEISVSSQTGLKGLE